MSHEHGNYENSDKNSFNNYDAPQKSELSEHSDACKNCGPTSDAFSFISETLSQEVAAPPNLLANVMAAVTAMPHTQSMPENVVAFDAFKESSVEKKVARPRIKVFWRLGALAACLAIIAIAANSIGGMKNSAAPASFLASNTENRSADAEYEMYAYQDDKSFGTSSESADVFNDTSLEAFAEPGEKTLAAADNSDSNMHSCSSLIQVSLSNLDQASVHALDILSFDKNSGTVSTFQVKEMPKLNEFIKILSFSRRANPMSLDPNSAYHVTIHGATSCASVDIWLIGNDLLFSDSRSPSVLYVSPGSSDAFLGLMSRLSI